jgi:hypothetical protein
MYCASIRRAKWEGTNATEENRWNGHKRALDYRSASDFRTYGASCFTKYRSLNLNHWFTAGRVEFRLQAGTVNYTKIIRWIQLLSALCARVKAVGAPPVQLSINQPRPELGFTPAYVLKALGVLPSGWSDPHPACADLAAWVTQRRTAMRSRQASSNAI